MAQGTCDSCGAGGEHLSPVQRVYFDPTDDVTQTVDPDVENWCPSCVTLYPHTTGE